MKKLFTLFLLISLSSFLQAARLFGDCKNKKTYTAPREGSSRQLYALRTPSSISEESLGLLYRQFNGLAINDGDLAEQQLPRAGCPPNQKKKHREAKRDRRRRANNNHNLQPRELFPKNR